MPVYEQIKSLICTPTNKCCEILCANCTTQSGKSPANKEEHQHAKIQLSKDQEEHLLDKGKKTSRRVTGWAPIKKVSDESSESDDSDEPIKNIKNKQSLFDPKTLDKTKKTYWYSENPIESKWADKNAAVYSCVAPPRIETSQTQNEDPVKSIWENKNAAIYSSVTASNERPSRYWVQQSLQYIIVLPNEKRPRTPSPENKKTSDEEEESDESDESFDSEMSFEPRSNAKPPAKKKKGFLCFKRQAST